MPAREDAIATLRRVAAALAETDAGLSAACANAADALRWETRGRVVIKAEDADRPVWKVDIRFRPSHERGALTERVVVEDGVGETDARIAWAALEQRAAANDPALKRPVRIRLWRGDELRAEVEWR